MDDVTLLPCPFCGGGDTTIEGKGMIWSGVKGYSDPQWYELRHWGVLSKDDPFNRCDIIFRGRTEADAIAAWNRCTPASDGRAEGLREAAEIAESLMDQWATATYQNMDARMQNAAKTYAAGDIVSAILARAAEGDSHE